MLGAQRGLTQHERAGLGCERCFELALATLDDADVVERGGNAGVLLANHTDFISPAMMHWTRSGDLIIMAVLGGMGSVLGPVIGAIALLLFEEALSGITEYWQIIMGPLLLAVVLFARGGIDGMLASLRRA